MQHFRSFYKVTWSKLVSAGMCLLALAVYWTVTPSLTKVQAFACGPCFWGGEQFSQGACKAGQKCVCVNDSPFWEANSDCPC